MSRLIEVTALCLLCGGLPPPAVQAQDGFAEAAVGSVPAGWSPATTGSRVASVWKIQVDPTAPEGERVLLQTAAVGPNSRFNLCIADQPRWRNLDVTVSLKSISGKIDQGGGLVWRYQDEKNYYLARVNPLEQNFRLFKVVDGERIQLGSVDVEAGTSTWETLRVVHRGTRIDCSLDGEQFLKAVDSSILPAGRIGVWTKADAVTAFTAPQIAVPSEETPEQAVVVNTQDESVSVVGLATMKEVARHHVGPRPYGIAVTRDGQTVAVGVEDEECVKFFSFPEFVLQGTTPIGRMFNDHIVLTQDGRNMMVANFYSDDVVLIDVATMRETGRIRGCSAPHVVKYGPLRQHAFVTCKKITGIAIIDPEAQQLVKFHQLNVNPRSLTFSPDESKAYFGSFWVNGFFEMDVESGKVTRLMSFPPPPENAADQEITYHGVEAVGNNIVLAANEGRSYVDAVDVSRGVLLDRLTTVNKPCCIERIPGPSDLPTRVLISNLGDGTLQLIEVGAGGKLREIRRATVGKAPKRVAFIPRTDF